MNELLEHYVVAVRHPRVSGFEHLDMLLTRDKLAERVEELNPDERKRLAEADRRLLTDADQFYAELSRITDLAHERRERNAPATHWWWYLDVLAHLPERAEPAAA